MKLSFKTVLLFLAPFIAKEALAQPASALVAEAESGYLLIKENVGEELPPASLTKVMIILYFINQICHFNCGFSCIGALVSCFSTCSFNSLFKVFCSQNSEYYRNTCF